MLTARYSTRSLPLRGQSGFVIGVTFDRRACTEILNPSLTI
jgi:hypothetical protein